MLSNSRFSHPTFILDASIAFVWLFTGLAVFHPYYREEGIRSLELLGLPARVMYATCALEVLLAIFVLLRKPHPWLLLVWQIAMIAAFTLILSITQPVLLVSPFGVLTKNIPIVTAIIASYLWDHRSKHEALPWLLWGTSLVWIIEGLIPKLLLPQDEALESVRKIIPEKVDELLILRVAGVLEILLGVLTIFSNGRFRSVLLISQALGIIALTGIITVIDGLQWFHPFGPLTKNMPLITSVLLLLFFQEKPATNSTTTT